jgi:hypothetical protein
MESPDLSLSAYLDVYPEPALILEWGPDTVSYIDSFKVCYANTAFNDILGVRGSLDEQSAPRPDERQSEAIRTSFNEFLLQETCISPSPERFMDWLKGIVRAPNDLHFLESRFQFRRDSHCNTLDGPLPFLAIEWNGIVIKGMFVVLTGRTITSRTTTPSQQSLPESDVANLVPIEETAVVSLNTDTPERKPPSSPPQRVSRTSSKDIRTSSRTTPSSPTSDRPYLQMRNSFTQDESVPLSTWRNNEKVTPYLLR